MTRKERDSAYRLRRKKKHLCNRCSKPAVICTYTDPETKEVFMIKVLTHCKKHFSERDRINQQNRQRASTVVFAI